MVVHTDTSAGGVGLGRTLELAGLSASLAEWMSITERWASISTCVPVCKHKQECAPIHILSPNIPYKAKDKLERIHCLWKKPIQMPTTQTNVVIQCF